MSKEIILKEFNERFILKRHNDYVDEDSIGEVATGYGYTNEDIKQFISKAIDQTKKETRKETIKDIIKKINEVSKTNIDLTAYGEGFEYAIDLINNKLKK